MNIPLNIVCYSLALVVAAFCLVCTLWLICVFVKWFKGGCNIE